MSNRKLLLIIMTLMIILQLSCVIQITSIEVNKSSSYTKLTVWHLSSKPKPYLRQGEEGDLGLKK